MSEENQNRNNRSRSNGNSRNRNRSGGNSGNGGQRNRNNNRNNNRDGQGGGQGGSASKARNELQPPRSRRRPKPKPLTFWQKCLKAVGLYKDPSAASAPAKGGNSKGAPQGNKLGQKAGQKQGRVSGGGRVDKPAGGARKQARPDRKPREQAPPTEVSSPRLYVGNLSYDATEYDLEELFKGVGAVRNVELVYNRHTHKSKGYGFVTMGNVEEAERAVEVLHDQPFMGRKMIVNGARSKGPADGDKEGRPRRNSKPATTEPQPNTNTDIPAEEEVHSLAPKED